MHKQRDVVFQRIGLGNEIQRPLVQIFEPQQSTDPLA